jgi:hypothetical protein
MRGVLAARLGISFLPTSVKFIVVVGEAGVQHQYHGEAEWAPREREMERERER